MASKVSNIRTYYCKYFGATERTPLQSQIGVAKEKANAEGACFAEDGRAYAPFKRPLTKRAMQALNAKNK